MTSGVISSILNNSSILGEENSVVKLSENTDESKDFASVLQSAMLDGLNETQQLIDSAERAEIEFALGQSDNTHDLKIAQSKASLAVSYVVSVRDRLLEAYKEIMNMQI